MLRRDTLLASFFLKEEEMPKDWSLTGGQVWKHLQKVQAESYRCGYCSHDVASDNGLECEAKMGFVRICPHCNGPSFFSARGIQWPGAKESNPVAKLPPDVLSIYEEARDSLTVNAFTGAVMLCRKLLMHIAVERGAEKDKGFAHYVDWLIVERYAPKGAERWLDYIKTRANEANHEIMVMSKLDAEGILRLTEQLLRNVYELPESIPPLPAS